MRKTLHENVNSDFINIMLLYPICLILLWKYAPQKTTSWIYDRYGLINLKCPPIYSRKKEKLFS